MIKQYIFSKSGSVVTIVPGSEMLICKTPAITVKRVDSGKEMLVNKSALREFSLEDKEEYSSGYWAKYLNKENTIF